MNDDILEFKSLLQKLEAGVVVRSDNEDCVVTVSNRSMNSLNMQTSVFMYFPESMDRVYVCNNEKLEEAYRKLKEIGMIDDIIYKVRLELLSKI